MYVNKWVFVFIVLVTWCCVGKQNKGELALEMEKFYGKKILFTDSLVANWKKDSLLPKDVLTAPYKVVAYIDSVGCTPCALEHLTLWRRYTKKLNEWNVSLIFILRNSNKDEVNKILNELGITNTIFFDVHGEFEKKNQLPANAILRTFLLNQDNQVIFIGAPIQNEKSWILFEETMKKLIANKDKLPGLDEKVH